MSRPFIIPVRYHTYSHCQNRDKIQKNLISSRDTQQNGSLSSLCNRGFNSGEGTPGTKKLVQIMKMHTSSFSIYRVQYQIQCGIYLYIAFVYRLPSTKAYSGWCKVCGISTGSQIRDEIHCSSIPIQKYMEATPIISVWSSSELSCREHKWF